MVSRVGLEPTTPSLRGSCSNLLSYRPDSLIYYHFFVDLSIKFLTDASVVFFEEPQQKAAHADLVHPEGLEPTTLCSEDRCSNPLSYGCNWFKFTTSCPSFTKK